MFSNELIANVITIFHTFLILFVFIGIGLSIKYKRFRPIEAFLLLSAIVIWSLYGGCPLTKAEAYFRGDQGRILMQLGFIPYYLHYWFNVVVASQVVKVTTYLLALFFLGLTIEWELPTLKRALKRIK